MRVCYGWRWSRLVYVCVASSCLMLKSVCFFFQAEDGIRDLVRSRGLGDVYKRQPDRSSILLSRLVTWIIAYGQQHLLYPRTLPLWLSCLLYTSDAADERSSVDLGGRRIIKKKIMRRLLSRSLSTN